MAEALATYGTLAPGRENHHELAGLAGDWVAGCVHGHLVPEGWGAALGYPALRLDPAGPAVTVWIFRSTDLAAHWPRLDAFEGEGYRRVLITADTAEGPVTAWLYEAV